MEKKRSRWESRNREKGANNQLSSGGKSSLSEEGLGSADRKGPLSPRAWKQDRAPGETPASQEQSEGVLI